jgi:hypothetical protein
MWCMVLTCWICRFMQVALKPVSMEKWSVTFFKVDAYWDWVQPGRAYVSFPWVRGPIHHRVLFCLMLCLLHFEK